MGSSFCLLILLYSGIRYLSIEARSSTYVLAFALPSSVKLDIFSRNSSNQAPIMSNQHVIEPIINIVRNVIKDEEHWSHSEYFA